MADTRKESLVPPASLYLFLFIAICAVSIGFIFDYFDHFFCLFYIAGRYYSRENVNVLIKVFLFILCILVFIWLIWMWTLYKQTLWIILSFKFQALDFLSSVISKSNFQGCLFDKIWVSNWKLRPILFSRYFSLFFFENFIWWFNNCLEAIHFSSGDGAPYGPEAYLEPCQIATTEIFSHWPILQ